MSVLVKDMEMPETCDCCPFHIYYSHYDYVCKATPMLYPMNIANSKGIRKDWCPLSEAPEPCEDAVSRADVVDMLEMYPFTEYGEYESAREAVKRLPSAQPEIIRCKDCKYQDEGYRRISVKWLPCMDIRPGSNWYCGSAERREE